MARQASPPCWTWNRAELKEGAAFQRVKAVETIWKGYERIIFKKLICYDPLMYVHLRSTCDGYVPHCHNQYLAQMIGCWICWIVPVELQARWGHRRNTNPWVERWSCCYALKLVGPVASGRDKGRLWKGNRRWPETACKEPLRVEAVEIRSCSFWCSMVFPGMIVFFPKGRHLCPLQFLGSTEATAHSARAGPRFQSGGSTAKQSGPGRGHGLGLPGRRRTGSHGTKMYRAQRWHPLFAPIVCTGSRWIHCLMMILGWLCILMGFVMALHRTMLNLRFSLPCWNLHVCRLVCFFSSMLNTSFKLGPCAEFCV